MMQFKRDTATTIAPSIGLYTIKIGTNNNTATRSVMMPRNFVIIIDRILFRLCPKLGNWRLCSLNVETGRFMI